jgi:hypothetical protein
MADTFSGTRQTEPWFSNWRRFSCLAAERCWDMVAWVIAEYGWWLEAQRPEPDEPNEETRLHRGDAGCRTPLPKCWLRAAGGVRAAKVQHVVQDPDSDGALGVSPVAKAALGGSDKLLPQARCDPARSHAAAAVSATKDRFERIDVLVNNAGYGQLGWFENTSDEQIRSQFETNVFSGMHVTWAVLPLMREQRSGHVFTISSMAGLVSVAGGTIYVASKFAVEGWSRCNKVIGHSIKRHQSHNPGFGSSACPA